MVQQQKQQQHAALGTDTFRGSASAATFFSKTHGQSQLDQSGLLKVSSPVSGHTLTVPDGCGQHHHAAIKDPITGSVLRLEGQAAHVVTPVMRQPQVHSRRFLLTKDIDIAIATLRATTRVSDKTNEKTGTSGSTTGLDRSLVAGGKPQ